MAKVTLTGDALVIKSSVSVKDWEMVKKYRPEALTLKDENDNPLFKVDIGTGGGVSNYGISFTGKTHDENEYATFTEGCKVASDVDAKEAIADYVGSAILKLNELENKIPDIIDEIKLERAKVINNITID